MFLKHIYIIERCVIKLELVTVNVKYPLLLENVFT